MVEVGGFEPPSLVLDQVDRLTPPVVCCAASPGGIATQSRLNAMKKRSLVYQKSPLGENLEGRALEVHSVEAVANANGCRDYANGYADDKDLIVW